MLTTQVILNCFDITSLATYIAKQSQNLRELQFCTCLCAEMVFPKL